MSNALHTWIRAWHEVRRTPLRSARVVRFRRPALVLFCIEVVVCLGVLGAVALLEGGELEWGWLLVFAVTAAITEFAEIRPSSAGSSVINDLFLVVPMVFFSPAAGATFILLATTLELLLRPRPLLGMLARAGSSLALQTLAFGAVWATRSAIEGSPEWAPAAIVAAGFVAIRVNDYTLFPLSAQLGIPDEFDYREYLRVSGPFEAIAMVIELPLAILAAYAWLVSPWLVLLLVVPYLSIWRITLLRPIVSELRASDELKTRFLSMASHEVRTPLTSIYGFATTLRSHWDELADEQRLEFVGIIEQQARRLSRLTTDLLTMSHIESGRLVSHPERVGVRRAIEQAIRESADSEIVVDCPEGLAVHVDPIHLQQVLANYIVNAHKYGDPPIVVEAHERGTWVEVRVHDAGSGVAPDFVPRLFESFSQAHDKPAVDGTGLGLAIVRRLARSYGGEAWYEQGTPRGATFCVRLPAAEVD